MVDLSRPIVGEVKKSQNWNILLSKVNGFANGLNRKAKDKKKKIKIIWATEWLVVPFTDRAMGEQQVWVEKKSRVCYYNVELDI